MLPLAWLSTCGALVAQPALRPTLRSTSRATVVAEFEPPKLPDLPKLELPGGFPNPFGGGGDGATPAPAPVRKQPNARWPEEAILDESLPDPVYDGKSPYLGRVEVGFTRAAEVLNGRVAMMGFVGMFLIEAVTGNGIIGLLGLSYDSGATEAAAPITGLFAWVTRALALAGVVGTTVTIRGLGGRPGMEGRP